MAEVAHHFDDGAAYERFMGRWSRAAGAIFLDWVAAPAGARWLDVGCGTGVFTELVLEQAAPGALDAIDPAPEQVAYARGRPVARRAAYHVADAGALPFRDHTFDVVASALVLNFVPDQPRALAEMRRVARPGGIVCGYVWDFAAEQSPSWPFRRGMRAFGADVPDVPGTESSGLAALQALFVRAGLADIGTQAIEVALPFRDFDDFWQAQTPSYSPTTRMIAALATSERARLMDTVRSGLPFRPDGTIAYAARAHAIKARLPE